MSNHPIHLKKKWLRELPPQIKNIYIYIYKRHHFFYRLSTILYSIGLYHLDHQQFIQLLRPVPCLDHAGTTRQHLGSFFGCFEPCGFKQKQNGGKSALEKTSNDDYI